MGEGNPPFPKSPPITISHVRSFLPSFPPYFIALYVGEQVRGMGEGGRERRPPLHACRRRRLRITHRNEIRFLRPLSPRSFTIATFPH